MRAVAFSGVRNLELVRLPVPDPGHGQAVVRVAACGVCGSDLHLYELDAMPAGSVMGHEFCGVVEAVGPGGGLEVGERCVGWPLLACRQCAACHAGLVDRCDSPRRTGIGGNPGAYAECVLIDTETALRVPAAVDDITAALTEPLSVGLHAVRRSRLRPGDSCVVVGAGCIGLMVVQCALLGGAVDVTVVEPAVQRGEAARRFGATRVLASAAAARDQGAGRPADVAFECAGAPGTLQLAADMVRRGGEVVGVGVSHEDSLRIPVWLTKELTLRMASETHSAFPLALRLLVDGRVRPASMVSRQAALEELPALFAAETDARREVKAVWVPGPASPG